MDEHIQLNAEQLNEVLEHKKPIWVSVKQLFKVLREMDMWSMDTKYLNIYLDTRFINGDYHCTIKTRNGDEYLSLEDLKERRRSINDLYKE